MLKLVRIELKKLRRKKGLWLMLLSAFLMPFFAFLYFGYLGQTDVEPAAFYKWSAFGYTLFLILPFILGLFGTMLIHDENRYDIVKQLWIVPVSKMGYFISKFCVLLLYSLCFMLINALASILFSILPNYVSFDWNSIIFLLERCFEISVLTAFAILPILSISASQKGYIFPVCITLIYVLAGFLLTPVNSCLHPLSCALVMIARNGAIPGIVLPQNSISLALFVICIWDLASLLYANFKLNKRK